MVDLGGARGYYVGGVEFAVHGVCLAGVNHEEEFVVSIGSSQLVSPSKTILHIECMAREEKPTSSSPTSAQRHPQDQKH